MLVLQIWRDDSEHITARPPSDCLKVQGVDIWIRHLVELTAYCCSSPLEVSIVLEILLTASDLLLRMFPATLDAFFVCASFF